MICQFERADDQKQFYFQLNSAFKMKSASHEGNFAGFYVIYNDDVCMYVGQSQNLPSRLATHLCGKYKDCTRVDVYLADMLGFEDFYSRNSESKKTILEYNEKSFIRLFSPIENINANHTFKPEPRKSYPWLYEAIETDGDKENPDLSISIDMRSLVTVSDFEVYQELLFNNRLFSEAFVDNIRLCWTSDDSSKKVSVPVFGEVLLYQVLSDEFGLFVVSASKAKEAKKEGV